MTTRRTVFSIAMLAAMVALGAVAMPAAAHHSFGRYDMLKTATVEGTVNKFEWSNPHCWLFVDVPVGDKTVTYGFEMMSVGEMLRRGWTKTALKAGDRVKVSFRPVRDGTPAGLHVTTFREGTLVGKPLPTPGPNGGLPGGPPPGGGSSPGGGAQPPGT